MSPFVELILGGYFDQKRADQQIKHTAQTQGVLWVVTI